MATQFKTIHIFGYGETQVIGEDFNDKVPNSELTTVDPVVADVYSHKPADSDASADIHAVNIFEGMFADYQPKSGNGFRVEYDKLNATLIQALADEVEAKKPQEQAKPTA